MSQDFKQYHSIENLARTDFIESIKTNHLDQGEFIVQEKVHGANLTFITDGIEIKCAKRTGLLGSDEKFFNYQKIKDRYKEKILKTFEEVKKLEPTMDFLYIFGELFGGYYPHPEVAKVRDAIKLQQGVFYSPDNDFYAFDLRILNKSYLNLNQSMEIFEKIGFLYAKPLFKGTLGECLQYPNEFESYISNWLALPKIENNIAEGIVIKPSATRFLPDKSRVIIKNKNPKYEEKIVKKNKIKKPKLKISDKIMNLQEEVKTYINQNRLESVISKAGKPDIGFFAKDVLVDFLKDHNADFNALEKEEQKIIKQFISQECSRLCYKNES